MDIRFDLAMKTRWSIMLVAGIALAGIPALILTRGEAGTQETQPPAPAVSGTSGQPIAFPHNRHVSEFQIDCQYCHFAVERSQSAGIPPVATCMGCHTQVSGSQNPQEIELLRGYSQRGEAIPWNRIYKVADHVQFPHMRHIAAGVECSSCHGNVAEIGVIQEVNQPLTMGFCVNCHIEQGASRDCAVCHY